MVDYVLTEPPSGVINTVFPKPLFNEIEKSIYIYSSSILLMVQIVFVLLKLFFFIFLPDICTKLLIQYKIY